MGWIKRAVGVYMGGFLHNCRSQLKYAHELHIQEDSPVSFEVVRRFLLPFVAMSTVYSVAYSDGPTLTDYHFS